MVVHMKYDEDLQSSLERPESVQLPRAQDVPAQGTKISVQHLWVYYRNTPAIQDVSLDIPDRKVTAIIGPSGCGKSTFLRCLNRMNDLIPGVSVSGKVILDGCDIYDHAIDVVALRKRVGMVWQRPNPFPMSIWENVAFGPKCFGINSRESLERIVEDSLKKAALWDEVKNDLKKSALALSGGQQQRLCIARALAVEPEVLLMDEPTASLDPISAGRIESLIAELSQYYTVVIVTHNMQQAARVSDYTAFFLSGRLIEFGPTQAVFTNPRHKETERYITGRFG